MFFMSSGLTRQNPEQRKYRPLFVDGFCVGGSEPWDSIASRRCGGYHTSRTHDDGIQWRAVNSSEG